MTIDDFIKHWKEVIMLSLAVLGGAYATVTFYRTQLYANDDLQVIAIGQVDQHLPPNRQDRLSFNLVVTNKGTSDGVVAHAEIVALHLEPQGHYAWVRIWPEVGEGFQPRALKPGEATVIQLITAGYAHEDYFLNPQYARPIDAGHHEFALGIQVRSVDSKGRIHNVLYPVSQFKIPNDLTNGPTDGFTFDCSVHHLFVDAPETVPPLAKSYGFPGDCLP